MSAQPDEPAGRIPVRLIKPEAVLETTQAEDESLPAFREDDDVEPLEGQIVDNPDGPRTVLELADDIFSNPYIEGALRQAGHIVVGAVVLVQRRRDHHTPAPYLRAMEAAKAIGDQEKALEWAELAADFRRDQHLRRIERAEMVSRLALPMAKGTAIGITGFGVLLAAGRHDFTQVFVPWKFLGDATVAVVEFAGVVWLPALLSAPVILVLILWVVGRGNVETSEIGWVRALNAADLEGEPITPSLVVTAFRDLGIPALRKAIAGMPDGGAAMLSPIVIAGCGVQFDVTLPSGVSTEEIQRQRRKLAENLGRHEHEVFITIPPAARTVRLWAADYGALDEPIGPSPLVTDPDMRADMYTGRAPWGENLRGDVVLVRLHERHVLVTGLSNEGKTSSLRALALWLALDPTVEFRIGDLKGMGDWRMFDGLATVLIQGPRDEHVAAVTEMVEDAVQEMERRLIAIEESGTESGVTREMARSGRGFHPIVVIVDEAQVAYMCPAKGDDGRPYGGQKNTSRFFMAARKLHNQGRAVNVTLWEGTQDPTDQNLPKLVREGAHLRASLVVGTESQAKMALGETPVEAGAAPHKLRQGLDKGTLVAVGDALDIPAGEPSMTVRTYYVDGAEATKVADRAKARRAKVATRTTRVETQQPRELLTDLEELLRDLPAGERVRLAHLPGMLTALAPGYAPYESLTGVAIKARLDSWGVTTTNTGGVPRLKLSDFRDVFDRIVTQKRIE